MRISAATHVRGKLILAACLSASSPTLSISDDEDVYPNLDIFIHDGCDLLTLRRAVEAFNAVMDGRETPPRTVPIVAVIEDREQPVPHLAAAE